MLKQDKIKKLYIEIADTFLRREYGLKDRKHLSQNAGMLFKFNHSNYLTFWMRNTYIPLDIAFINDDGRIFQIEEMIPLNTRAINSYQKCKYALEVNQGWFKKNNIDIGSKIRGVGIESNQKRCAQIMTPVEETPPVGELLPELPPEPQERLTEPSSDVILNLSFKERLKSADLKGKDMVIVYQTKGGLDLPPKVISPPFIFEEDAEGKHDAIVKGWDNQDAGWKSFLIDNIIDLDEK